MISNSTGPLHMAVALNVPTVSFYPHSPAVMSAKRWGPYSQNKPNRILSPKNGMDPMSSITVENAFQAVKEILK